MTKQSIRKICEAWFYSEDQTDYLNVDELIELLEKRERN